MSRFADIRRLLGLTQAEMAEALDCSQSNVSFLDRGQTVTPETAKKLIEVAGVVGVQLSYAQIYGDAVLPAPRVGQAQHVSTDWPRVARELRARGWTPLLVAARIGCGIAAVARLFDGEVDDPAHSLGAALLKLHARGELPGRDAASRGGVAKAA